MPKITPEIKDALVRLADDMGSAIEISRKTGISHSTFSKYFSGQISRIIGSKVRVLVGAPFFELKIQIKN